MNVFHTMEDFEPSSLGSCLLSAETAGRLYQGQAEDILTDDDLLELFRIVKKILRKKPDTERISKLLFCMCYSLGDDVKFSKSIHDNRILFTAQLDQQNVTLGIVQLPNNSSCCDLGQTTAPNLMTGAQSMNGDMTCTDSSDPMAQRWINPSFDTSGSPLSRLLSTAGLTEQSLSQTSHTNTVPDILHNPRDETSTDSFSVRPYTTFRSIHPASLSAAQSVTRELGEIGGSRSSQFPLFDESQGRRQTEVLMEPKQRGFYYQDGRIAREPMLLQRYAEQGVLTQASLIRKRKRQLLDLQFPFEMNSLPFTAKKPKVPHRHGEFEQRRDDIISRMRSITLSDLEQKAQRLPPNFTLAIEKVPLPTHIDRTPTTEEAADLLEPALRVLTMHSNMKPHLDNGMNQNGIYYNTDYFQLYQAFEQFQTAFSLFFPNEVVKSQENEDALDNRGTHCGVERDRDRERNANMKAYRGWIEPLLTETNWAAFRRNIVVGERIKHLTTIVGQGVLLMTKELSGSKLHLTFTNNEWDEFIHGLSSGKWDDTITWDSEPSVSADKSTETSLLVYELQKKFATHHWFRPDGSLLPQESRKRSLRAQHESSTASQSRRNEQAEGSQPPQTSNQTINTSLQH